MYSDKRCKQILKNVDKFGFDAVLRDMKIKEGTLKRIVRKAKERDEKENPFENQKAVVSQIINRYSNKELMAIAKGHSVEKQTVAPIHDFVNEEMCIGVMSDTHLGSKYTNPDFVSEAFEQFAIAEVDMVVHSGDVTEGMSNKQGHVYECSHIGYHAQKKHAIEVLKQWDSTPFYMISGNHDQWYAKSNGALIVDDICREIPNAEYLGYDEGQIKLSRNVTLRLWHGLDGSSYATSYRLQKLIESYTGGDKPEVLIAGHVHKMIYAQIRHVQCISAGSIQKQSKWMRSKRLASHTGFWIIWIGINKKGVSTFRSQWFPFYV